MPFWIETEIDRMEQREHREHVIAGIAIAIVAAIVLTLVVMP